MSGHVRLEIVTPEGKAFASNVSELQFPTAYRGHYGILPGHTPVLTPLGDGAVTCTLDGVKNTLNISGGFAEVGPDTVTILATKCWTDEV